MMGPDRAVRIPPANRNDPIGMDSTQGFLQTLLQADELGSRARCSACWISCPVRVPRPRRGFLGLGFVHICDCSIPAGWFHEIEYYLTWIPGSDCGSHCLDVPCLIFRLLWTDYDLLSHIVLLLEA